MKKISLLLAVVMLLTSLCLPVLAEEPVETEVARPFDVNIFVVEAHGEQPKLVTHVKNIIEVDGYKFKDLNGNGELDKYEDWRLETSERVADLISQMTLEEKIGTLYANNANVNSLYPLPTSWLYSQEKLVKVEDQLITPMWEHIINDHVSTFLFNMAGQPYELLEEMNAMQEIAEYSRLGVPLIFCCDRAYNTWGSMVDKPHYAFGASHDPELTYEACKAFATEMDAIGYHVVFQGFGVEIGAWFGDEPTLRSKLAVAEATGYQAGGISATTKHFIARGGRKSFDNANSPSLILNNWVEPWRAVVEAGTDWIMSNMAGGISGDVKVYFDSATIGMLRNEFGYDGVLVTDWPLFSGRPEAKGITPEGEDLSELNPGQLYTIMLRNGFDLFGGYVNMDNTDLSIYDDNPTGQNLSLLNWPAFLKESVEDGYCSIDLIDNALRRILTNKYNHGLFENPYEDWEEARKIIGSEAYINNQYDVHSTAEIISARNDYMNDLDERIQVASTILLKNEDNVLPLKEGVKLFVTANVESTAALDTEALAKYAEIVENIEDADYVVARITKLNDVYDEIVETVEAAQKPLIIVFEGDNGDFFGYTEPSSEAVDACVAMLMPTYENDSDHGKGMGGFFNYTQPNIVADMIFGVRTPGGRTVYEMARTQHDADMEWRDLPWDTGMDDATRLYWAQMMRNDPTIQIPNNLGDPLFPADYGLTYGEEAQFSFNSLILPRGRVIKKMPNWQGTALVDTEVTGFVNQKAGVPFEINFVAQNDGADGHFTAVAYVDGEEVASKFVSVSDHQFCIVTMEIMINTPGTHELTVCGLTETVVVEE